MTGSTRWLLFVGLAAVALVTASLVVGRLVGGEVEFEAGSPEATVQAYLRAVADGDATTAYEFYSDGLRERCELTHVRDSLRFGPEDFRATLVEVIPRGETTEVVIDLTQFYGQGPFDGGQSDFQQVFVLQEEDGAWRFVEAPWPTWCPTPVPDDRPSTGALASGIRIL